MQDPQQIVPKRQEVRLADVDVLYGSRNALVYDPVKERYIICANSLENDDINGDAVNKEAMNGNGRILRKMRSWVGPKLRAAFLPEGVTPSYYRFIKWRILQRFVNANVHVFGTQSLLMGLGLKSARSLGLSAALNWVLKDALGKIVRMAWASKMGRKFDSDAKRWRFRSAFLFAAGNGLEIITYIFPSLFLLFATMANCCKQMSMLTSSSTRTALYNSFKDGSRENIGDITAKGEAQIAVVDLFGIASGVCLSRAVGMSVRSVLGVYVVLQIAEIFCMYHEIRAVEFKVLNFERLVLLVEFFVAQRRANGVENGSKDADTFSTPAKAYLPSPQQLALKEKIFMPPAHLARRAICFGSLSRSKLSPDELKELMDIFCYEKFILVVGADVKNRNRRRQWRGPIMDHIPAEEHCHIVLHADASNIDIVKSTLALSLLRQSLAKLDEDRASDDDEPLRLRSRDCMHLIRTAYQEADSFFPTFLKTMMTHGWAPPARFMFGRTTRRAEWPLRDRRRAGTAATTTTTTTPAISNINNSTASIPITGPSNTTIPAIIPAPII
jgi:hypothetical protein